MPSTTGLSKKCYYYYSLWLVFVRFGATHRAYSVNSNDCIFQKHDIYVVGKIMVGMIKVEPFSLRPDTQYDS